MTAIRLICATREPEERFETHTALGRSLILNPHHDVERRIFYSNSKGLSHVYNRAIDEAAHDPSILVFVHDDVEFTDYFWSQNIRQGLKDFPLIGVHGNRRRVPHQRAWAFHTDPTVQDVGYLSGSIGKCTPRGRVIHYFGPSYQPVKLLDGALLACRPCFFSRARVRFDEQFEFHFYDLDLCRQLEERDIRIGTWGVSIVHESMGDFESAEWNAACERYFAKWGS